MLMFVTMVAFEAMTMNQTTWAQMIVAHRGASYDAPENTLSAFRLAFEQNADGVEGDFYITADQQIVCIHDKDTKRTAGTKLDVATSTLADLRKLEYGSWFDAMFSGERIPTFREVLEVIPNHKLFVIELKTGPEIVPQLKRELESFDLEQRQLLIITFNADTVVACKSQLPGIRVHWLTGFDAKDGVWTPSLDEVISTTQRIKADGIGMKGVRELIDADFIASLRSASIPEFHFWTIDKIEDAQYFKDLGAFGITTNRPGFIRQGLHKRSQ